MKSRLVLIALECLGGLRPARADQPALVLIDMQPHYVERNWQHDGPRNRAKLKSVLARQMELVAGARQHHRPIVLVEREAHAPTYAELLRAIGSHPLAITVPKRGNDAFCPRGLATETLRRFLNENYVNELVVAGANGSSCVRESIEGALAQGLRIWADSAGIIDFRHWTFEHPYRFASGQIRIDASVLPERFDQGDALFRFERGEARWVDGPPRSLEGSRIYEDEWAEVETCRHLLEQIDVLRHVDLLSDLMDATSFDRMIDEARRLEDESR